jgi:hypothetical protein
MTVTSSLFPSPFVGEWEIARLAEVPQRTLVHSEPQLNAGLALEIPLPLVICAFQGYLPHHFRMPLC